MGVRWSSSLEPVKAISQVLFEMMQPWTGIKNREAVLVYTKEPSPQKAFLRLGEKKEARAKIKQWFILQNKAKVRLLRLLVYPKSKNNCMGWQ